jgi:hypothetical protein
MNGRTTCYEIPISSCTFIKKLEDIVPQDKRNIVIKQQKEWLNNNVKNRDYTYSDRPDWVLKEVWDNI